MSSRNMKLDEIAARAQEALATTEQRRKDALDAWQAVEDQASAARLKTEKLRALRLARDAEEAAAKAVAPISKAVVKRPSRVAAKSL
ncbi:transcriptional regulator [Bosea beijingensis]|uniref:transcriptional regulator n=1 Tax=Bosea beijingensis TaxID=3068632 RepID=UPI0027418BAD|nr:transcriptional regulator [Bosea sp. REN20]